MKRFRTVLFWIHLIAGLTAGISIGIMCFTGAALAFESELTSWSERDARRVTPPPTPETPRLALDDLLKKVRETQPEIRPSGITISPDPKDAVAFVLGREGAIYANPYTGEVRRPASTKIHDSLHVLEDWHRVLAMGGDNRTTGKMINGACNLAFFLLAVTGLYLWWPRSWSWRSVRAIGLFNWKFSGKARDFNWHNVIGLWSAPVLIVLTITAVPISYRWGANLIYRIAGETPPIQLAAGGLPASPTIEIPKPAAGTRPLGYDALLVTVQREIPEWKLITFRLGGVGRAPAAATGQGQRPAAQAVSVTVKEPGSWPRTATTTLTLNPYTGEILKREGYADLAASRQIRSWTRFLHTGQALGWPGQLAAGLACLGGCVLVYTGFALAWRRFFGPKNRPASVTANGI
jgi:uncharacterized iron-regulated membrane protein